MPELLEALRRIQEGRAPAGEGPAEETTKMLATEIHRRLIILEPATSASDEAIDGYTPMCSVWPFGQRRPSLSSCSTATQIVAAPTQGQDAIDDETAWTTQRASTK